MWESVERGKPPYRDWYESPHIGVPRPREDLPVPLLQVRTRRAFYTFLCSRRPLFVLVFWMMPLYAILQTPWVSFSLVETIFDILCNCFVELA